MSTILGVDPGAAHVGISWWRETEHGWECNYSMVMQPTAFVRWVTTTRPGAIERIITEGYVPMTGYGQAKTGIETQWIVGYLHWWAKMAGVPFETVTRANRDAARTRITAAGYPFRVLQNDHSSDHAKDAESVVVAALKL